MINNYTRPQLFIRQVLDILDDAGPKRLNAFIFGPQYNLKRYTDPSERATLQGTTFNSSAHDLPYEGKETGTTVDLNFVKVYGEDLLVTLGVLDDTDAPVFDGSSRNILVAANGSDFAGQQLASELDGRSVSVGDIVIITVDSVEYTRTVTSVNGTSRLTLNGAVPGSGNPDEVKFQLRYTGEIPSSNYTANADDVSINANATVNIQGRSNPAVALINDEGKLFVSYRAFVPAANTESYVILRSRQDIVDNFGKVDPDNTLAYGAYVALTGAQGEYIYGARVTSNDIDGYNAVLRTAENSDVLYALCPLTYDANIQNAVKDHVEAMSTDNRKQWRRAYLATKNPGEYPAIADSNGTAKTLTGIVATLGSASHVVTAADGNFIVNNVQAGDLVRIGGNDYTVRNVLSGTELEVAGSPSTGSVSFTVIKPATGRSQAEYVAARSKELNSRRAVNVWVDSPMAMINGVLTEQEVIFVAAEIAGLRSALLPQQGLTRTEIATIHSAPLMYTMYTQDELDIAAASGTFIVTQDVENGPVYVRHQLTTRTTEGSLYYEDSAGTNIDNLSYLLKDQYEPLIGVENATPDSIRKIRTRAQDVLLDQSRGDPDLNIGPAVISIPEGFPQVYIDPVMRDTIRVAVKVEIPLPLNSIVVDLFATVTTGGQ